MMHKQTLLAATVVTDITPPLEIGLLTSSVNGSYAPFRSMRLPLKARVLALNGSGTPLILLSLELLGLNDTAVGGWQRFKQGLSEDISPDQIILTCTHTHNAPESLAFSTLYQQDIFKAWILKVQSQLREAIRDVLRRLEPVTLDFGNTVLDGFALQRRIPTPGGIVLSDSLQPLHPELLEREPVDKRISILRINTLSGSVMATLVHAVCHPVHEMCLPQISPDFPGELCLALERSGTAGTTMFLNGAAGNINPPTVSEGAEAAHRHGIAIAEAVKKGYPSLVLELLFAFRHVELKIPVRQGYRLFNPEDAMARISVLALGDLALAFLPGEPFLEIALSIEARSPFAHTLITGYSENSIGYIPTVAAIREGGYEAGPGKWSYLCSGADRILADETLHLLRELKASQHEIS